MADRFLGAWRVTEYVHDPDGRLAGVIHQHRRLEGHTRDGVDLIRVTQVCAPDPALSDHPMGAFAGTWVFDLRADGAVRHYLGPDVVGHGTEWADGAMTGAGIWPRFGHTFESYAVLVSPGRQITGGFFHRAGAPTADIVGVAVPDEDDRVGVAVPDEDDRVGVAVPGEDGEWPELDLSSQPPAVAPDGPAVARRIGPMLVMEAWPSSTTRVRTLAVSDTTSHTGMVISDRTADDERTVTIEVRPTPTT